MSTTLGVILRRMAGVTTTRAHQPDTAGRREKINPTPLNDSTEPRGYSNRESSPARAPVHPRMGGPFSGKIRWKAK